jgi:N-acetylneuraminic acid mutarotase
MVAWHGRQCGSPNATFADIGGYPKPGNRQTVLVRNAARRCGTRVALTAGHVKRESRQGVVAGGRQGKHQGETMVVGHFAVGLGGKPIVLRVSVGTQ